MESFEKIAKTLKDYYSKAIQINFDEKLGGLIVGNSAIAVSVDKIARNSLNALVYLDDSPNYCKPDSSIGK